MIQLWTLLNAQQPNLADIQSAYEAGWNRLTEKFFAKTEWPEAEVIAPLVNHGTFTFLFLFISLILQVTDVEGLANVDEVFLTLYRELYYRHVIARLQPDLEDRIASYENYCSLFNLILNSPGPVPLSLPIDWLYNM